VLLLLSLEGEPTTVAAAIKEYGKAVWRKY
jgi:hypothetical protein